MIHMTGMSATSRGAIAMQSSHANLGRVLREQVCALTKDGYGDVDIRWNSDMLVIAASSVGGKLQRRFNRAGVRVMERIEQQGIGIKRRYAEDGLTVVSEEICGNVGDC